MLVRKCPVTKEARTKNVEAFSTGRTVQCRTVNGIRAVDFDPILVIGYFVIRHCPVAGGRLCGGVQLVLRERSVRIA